MQARIVRRIEAGFDSKRSEPAFSRHKWARTRAPIGLHSLEFRLDPIPSPANIVPQKGWGFTPGENEHSTSPSLAKSPKGASPATVRLRNPRAGKPLPVPQKELLPKLRNTALGVLFAYWLRLRGTSG
jgi:hypothetical protein